MLDLSQKLWIIYMVIIGENSLKKVDWDFDWLAKRKKLVVLSESST